MVMQLKHKRIGKSSYQIILEGNLTSLVQENFFLTFLKDGAYKMENFQYKSGDSTESRHDFWFVQKPKGLAVPHSPGVYHQTDPAYNTDYIAEFVHENRPIFIRDRNTDIYPWLKLRAFNNDPSCKWVFTLEPIEERRDEE